MSIHEAGPEAGTARRWTDGSSWAETGLLGLWTGGEGGDPR